MSTESVRRRVVDEWTVAADVDTLLTPDIYLLRVVEGGTYRNLASRRKYTVESTDADAREISYRYVRGEGEPVERTDEPTALAVVEAVGDTSPAVISPSDRQGGEPA
jgi:hypothetical protein